MRGQIERRAEGVPRPTPGRPDMPAHFEGTPLAALWERVCETLEDMSLMATADWAAVERYCLDLDRYRQCEDTLRRTGDILVVRTHNPQVPHIGELPQPPGSPRVYVVDRRPHPEVRLKLALAKELRLFEQTFGLSPSARLKLAAPLPGPSAMDEAGEPLVRARVRG